MYSMWTTHSNQQYHSIIDDNAVESIEGLGKRPSLTELFQLWCLSFCQWLRPIQTVALCYQSGLFLNVRGNC